MMLFYRNPRRSQGWRISGWIASRTGTLIMYVSPFIIYIDLQFFPSMSLFIQGVYFVMDDFDLNLD